MTRTRVERARAALMAAFERTGNLTSPDVLDASRRVDRLLAEFHRERATVGGTGRPTAIPWRGAATGRAPSRSAAAH